MNSFSIRFPMSVAIAVFIALRQLIGTQNGFACGGFRRCFTFHAVLLALRCALFSFITDHSVVQRGFPTFT